MYDVLDIDNHTKGLVQSSMQKVAERILEMLFNDIHLKLFKPTFRVIFKQFLSGIFRMNTQ